MMEAPTWPPKTITTWVNRGAVSTQVLIDEMQAWLTYWRSTEAEQVSPMPKSSVPRVCINCGEPGPHPGFFICKPKGAVDSDIGRIDIREREE